MKRGVSVHFTEVEWEPKRRVTKTLLCGLRNDRLRTELRVLQEKVSQSEYLRILPGWPPLCREGGIRISFQGVSRRDGNRHLNIISFSGRGYVFGRFSGVLPY